MPAEPCYLFPGRLAQPAPVCRVLRDETLRQKKTDLKLLTKDLRAKLIANGRIQDPLRGTEQEIDFRPVVKLFNPCGAGTWLLTEIDPADEDIAFGLCDLGVGCPEIGSVSLSELAGIRGRLGLGIERDLHFEADKTLLDYAREAWASGNIRA